MIAIKKYLPYILLAAGVLIGIFLSGGGGKDAERMAGKKIKQHETEIARLKQERKQLDKDRATIRAKAYKDSVAFSIELQARNKRILKLNRRIHEINLSRASGPELDSIITVLFPN